MFDKLTIKWKLILIILLASVLSMVMASSVFLIYRVIDLRTTMVATQRTIAGMLANSVVQLLASNDVRSATKLLGELQWYDAIDAAAVFDADDKVIAQYRKPKLLKPPLLQPPGNEEYIFTDDYLVVFRPVFFHNERIGTVCVMANLKGLGGLIRETVTVILVVIVFCSLIVLLLAGLLQRYISVPIRKLVEVTKHVAEHKNYNIQLEEVSQKDELGMLVDEFNKMLRKIAARDVALVEAKERLEKSSRELVDHRDHLEHLVEDRTGHLKSAYEEIRAFVFMFSHDLRTPLVNLKGFSGELRSLLKQAIELIGKNGTETTEVGSELTTLVSEEIPEALTFIEKAASTMDKLINAMLKLSFLGRRELEFQEVDATQVVEDLQAKMIGLIQSTNAEILLGPLPVVMADRVAFEQIVENILINALTYLDPNRRGIVRIWAEEGDDVFFFHVRDNGRGIEVQEIPKVFEPFRRLGSQGAQGQGMGMVYTKTLVNRHGGKIWCVSKPNEGTTFTFTLHRHPDKLESYAPLGT